MDSINCLQTGQGIGIYRAVYINHHQVKLSFAAHPHHRNVDASLSQYGGKGTDYPGRSSFRAITTQPEGVNSTSNPFISHNIGSTGPGQGSGDLHVMTVIVYMGGNQIGIPFKSLILSLFKYLNSSFFRFEAGINVIHPFRNNIRYQSVKRTRSAVQFPAWRFPH